MELEYKYQKNICIQRGKKLDNLRIPHIVFVDEQSSEHERFQRLFWPETKSNQVRITTLIPLQTLDEMIDEILAQKPDALVVDWFLNDIKENFDVNYDVEYFGSNLIQNFLEIRKGFPCFIATSLDENASKEESTFDVNMIYSKHPSFDTTETIEHSLTFKERVLLQISKYHALINLKENRFEELLDKKRDNNDLSHDEEVEIRELDSFLEAAIDNRAKTPEDLKEITNTKRLDSLLDRVNNLIIKLDQ